MSNYAGSLTVAHCLLLFDTVYDVGSDEVRR